MRKKNWYLTIGIILTACMLIFIAVGFFWTPYVPSAMSSGDRNGRPSLRHLFGCDSFGRDVFSRTLEGAGATLTIALAVLA
ncbi:MAG: ABC transporter permease, partial [Oscillospiraceae bacterium]|nr:ABC transporter permease [Oscillospiraceae bacterium]